MDMETPLGRMLLESYRDRFQNLYDLGGRALHQLAVEDWHRSLGADENSIAVIIQHLHGNMRSRWTDFLTTDGEKPDRNRDGEFEEDDAKTPEICMALWDEGWRCAFETLEGLREAELTRTITIRQQPLFVLDAIHRQLSHCGYHVGQIVQLARHWRGAEWETLSIARNASTAYKARPND